MEGRFGRVGQNHTQHRDHQANHRETAELWNKYEENETERQSNNPDKMRHTKASDVVKSVTIGGFVGGCAAAAIGTLSGGLAIGFGLTGALGYQIWLSYRNANKQRAQENYRCLQERGIEILTDLKKRNCLSPTDIDELQRLKEEVGKPGEKDALEKDRNRLRDQLREISEEKNDADFELFTLQSGMTSISMELEEKDEVLEKQTRELVTKKIEHELKVKELNDKRDQLSTLKDQQTAEFIKKAQQILKQKLRYLPRQLNAEMRQQVHDNFNALDEMLHEQYFNLTGVLLPVSVPEDDMEQSFRPLGSEEQSAVDPLELVDEMDQLATTIDGLSKSRRHLKKPYDTLEAEKRQAGTVLADGSGMQVEPEQTLLEEQIHHAGLETHLQTRISMLQASLEGRNKEAGQARKERDDGIETQYLTEQQLIDIEAAAGIVENELVTVRNKKVALDKKNPDTTTKTKQQKLQLKKLQEKELLLIEDHQRHMAALNKGIDLMHTQLSQMKTLKTFQLNRVKKKSSQALKAERQQRLKLEELLCERKEDLKAREEELTLKKQEYSTLKESSSELENRLRRYQERRLREYGEVRGRGSGITIKTEEAPAWEVRFGFEVLDELIQEVRLARVRSEDMLGYQGAQQLDQNLETAKKRLYDAMMRVRVDYVPDVEKLPSLEEQRSKMRVELETFTEEVREYQQAFLNCGSDSTEFHNKCFRLESCLKFAKKEIEARMAESKKFNRQSENVVKLQMQLSKDFTGKAARVIMRAAINAFNTVLRSPSEEIRNFGAGAVAKAVRDHFVKDNDFPFHEGNIESLEAQRVLLEAKRKAILQLRPEHLPLDMKRALSPRGEAYLNHLVAETTQILEQQSHPQTLKLDAEDLTRNEPGLAIAQRMLADPAICADVNTLLSSLGQSHEKIPKEHFSYLRASESGLEMIRQHHGLVYMPTMKELLTAAEHDLKQIDSKLTTEAVRQHKGMLKTKNGLYRREVLAEKCRQFLRKEHETGASGLDNASPLRGHPHMAGELVEHPHKDTLDCFDGANQQSLLIYDKSREMASSSSPVETYPLPDVPNGLMNTFFSGCNGEAQLRVNSKTKTERILISSGNTEPHLVFTKDNGSWQVNMGGSSWWVDPAFLIQNPNLVIPFEGEPSPGMNKQRDWIPVRDANNNTAILVLRKGTHDRYFLYERGVNDSLEVRPIGNGDPKSDRIEGAHLYWAARQDLYGAEMDSAIMSLTTHNLRADKAKASSIEIGRSNRCWVRTHSLKALDEAYDDIQAKETGRDKTPPLLKRDIPMVLDQQQIEVNSLRKIAEQKREKSQRTGAKLETFHTSQARFGPFSVHASFDKVSDKFYSECRVKAGGESPIIEQQKSQRKHYRDNVFRALTVFAECELTPGVPPVMVRTVDGSPEAGTPEQVHRSFGKVLKNSRDHCMRMTQQVGELRFRLVELIRQGQQNRHIKNLRDEGRLGGETDLFINANPVDSCTDQQLLDQAVILFEKGSMPYGLERNNDITDFVTWMLAENDLKQNTRKLHSLQKLNRSLERLVADAPVLTTGNKPEYVKRCQEWNLEMALVASDMKAMQKRLDRKGSQEVTTDAATRAIMSFERRAETVLRSGQGSNQVDEVHQTMGEVRNAMADDLSMARVSQLGTGWGKSTMVQLWSDYACGLNLGRSDRSVLVIAPARNKKDLDGTLQRYFDSKGLPCGSMDLMNEYVKKRHKHGDQWWYGDTLKQIHNKLLGVPRHLRPDQIEDAVAEPRGPVVASIQDVQILMHLRKGLQIKRNKSATEKQALVDLNAISDLLRESMVFADEWDSALIPPLSSELNEMMQNINVAIAGVPAQASPQSIIHDHGAFIFGCKRKHLLSATTGTLYAAAVASGAVNAQEVAAKCNTDPFTTTPRVWHLLELAEPVFVNSSDNEDLRKKTYQHVVNRVGPDRPVLLFNSEARNEDAFQQAIKNQDLLQDARKQYARTHGIPLPREQGMMYYDHDKKLCLLHPGSPLYDKGQGSVHMASEDEAIARASRGGDGCLGQSESVGTDIPQGMDSVGVVIGGLEQKDEGRLDLFTQQFGRVTRAMKSMRKPQQLFIVADRRAAADLPYSPERNSYLKSHDEMEAVHQELAGCFDNGKLPAAVARAVEKPIKVARALHDNMEDAAANVQANLEAALADLETGEYFGLHLNESAMKALLKVKRYQWQTKVKLVELLGAEFARRDVSANINKYEEMLEQAAIDSSLDQAFSEEDQWCKGLGEKDELGFTPLSDFEMEETSKNQLPDDPEIVRNIHEIVTSKAAELIGNDPRRLAQGKATCEDMAVRFDESARVKQIQEVFSQLKSEGISVGKHDPLESLKAELKTRGAGMLERSKACLVKIMDASGAVPDFEAGRRKAAELGNWSKLAGTGHQHNWRILHPLLKELEAKLSAVAQDDVVESVTVDEFMDYFCTELSRRINFVVVAVGANGVRSREQIAREVKSIFAEAGREKEIKLGTVSKNLGVLKKEAAQKLKQGIQQNKSIVYPSAHDYVDANVPLEQLQLKVRSKVMKPKQGGKQSRQGYRKQDLEQIVVYKAVTELPVQESYGYTDSNDQSRYAIKNLRTLCEQGRKAYQAKEHWDRAAAFCDPDQTGFRRCLDELEQYILKNYNAKIDEIKENLHRESERIRQQHKLMAAVVS